MRPVFSSETSGQGWIPAVESCCGVGQALNAPQVTPTYSRTNTTAFGCPDRGLAGFFSGSSMLYKHLSWPRTSAASFGQATNQHMIRTDPRDSQNFQPVAQYSGQASSSACKSVGKHPVGHRLLGYKKSRTFVYTCNEGIRAGSDRTILAQPPYLPKSLKERRIVLLHISIQHPQ